MDIYVNPAFPLDIDLDKTSSDIINSLENELKPLDEEKTVTDIFQLYFYSNEKKLNIENLQ